MTIQEDKLDLVARYMGWKWKSPEYDMIYIVSEGFWYNDTDDKWADCHIEEYVTSWDGIVEVTKKVLDELRDMKKSTEGTENGAERSYQLAGWENAIQVALLELDITSLFNAVVSAIDIINQYKKEVQDVQKSNP